MNDSIFHHYEPVFRLQDIANNKQQIYCLELCTNNTFITNIHKVGGENYYNTIEGENPNVIEHIFSQFESHCAPILKKFQNTLLNMKRSLFPFVLNERRTIIEFMSFQFLRSPAKRKDYDKLMSNILLPLLKEKALKENNIQILNIINDVEIGLIYLKHNNETYFQCFLPITLQIIEFINSKYWGDWTVFRNKDQTFIYSDKNVVEIWDQNHRYLYFTLGPHLLIRTEYLSNNTNTILQIQDIDHVKVNNFNKLLINNSYRFIYTDSQDNITYT